MNCRLCGAGLTLVDRIVANCESISHFAKEKKLRLATFANLYRVYFFIKLFEITSVLFPITAFYEQIIAISLTSISEISNSISEISFTCQRSPPVGVHHRSR